jgi:predicted ATP-dependent endonuclease of OLD family
MAINRVEIKDFLVFKGDFAMDFCHGVNVFIGSNGTGKTTLLKAVYIPEKDMLSNAKGLPETVKYNKDKAQYTQAEIEIIEKARVRVSAPEQPLYRKICGIIQAEPENDGESFFMRREGIKNPIPFSSEASGYRKFGLLATLIRNEQINPGTALFWDEPENSLNPELVPMLVDILLELSRNGVQIFIATHSELLADYFLVSSKNNDAVMFFSLYKDGDQIKYDCSDRFDLLNPNKLTDERVRLYEKRLDKAFGGE